jgi:hypothetical protein
METTDSESSTEYAMSQQPIRPGATAFDALIKGHIERTGTLDREIPADLFVDLLFERMATTDVPVTLSIDVQGDDVVITPDQLHGDVFVRGNEVLIGGRRLVLRILRRAA